MIIDSAILHFILKFYSKIGGPEIIELSKLRIDLTRAEAPPILPASFHFAWAIIEKLPCECGVKRTENGSVFLNEMSQNSTKVDNMSEIID